MKQPYIYLLAAPAILVGLFTILRGLTRLNWRQDLFADIDLNKCPPIGSNNKHMWAYWHQGTKNMPLFVRQNIEHWKTVAPDWEIRLIQGADPTSECHHSKFVDEDMLPKYFSHLLVQKQSDAVRLALIRLYGGIYMDVTVLLFEPPEINFWKYVDLPENHPEKKHMVGYYYPAYTLPGRKDGYEIWMIVATKQDPLIIKWHDLFLELLAQNPDPMLRNETTGELNPLFKGVDFSKLDEPHLNYGVSTSCLHALLQLNPEMNYLYENKSILRNADDHPGVYTLSYEWGWVSPQFYDFFFNRSHLTPTNITKVLNGAPLTKLINHAVMIKDQDYYDWRRLDNVLGFSRMIIRQKGKQWITNKTWNPNDHDVKF